MAKGPINQHKAMAQGRNPGKKAGPSPNVKKGGLAPEGKATPTPQKGVPSKNVVGR